MDAQTCLHAMRSLNNILLDDEDAVSSELIQKTLALALVQSLKANITLHKDFNELKDRLLDYEKKVDFIDRDLMDTQQYIRRWTVEIKGIPETIAQKDLQSYVVHQILERACGYKFHDSYIEAVHRLKKRNKNEPAHVVVRLVNRRDAENTIRGRWKLRSYGHLRNIFVMDNLCPRYRDIFEDLTDLKESGLVKQVWSYNGKVHYKTTHNRRAKGKRVWHMDDLKPLKESVLTLNFEREARKEYDRHQLPSKNSNAVNPSTRPRPPSPPSPRTPSPLVKTAKPVVAAIVTDFNITDVSDLSVVDDIPDLESSKDAESCMLAFRSSRASVLTSNSSQATNPSENYEVRATTVVNLSPHPTSSEMSETPSNELVSSTKSQDASNDDQCMLNETCEGSVESSDCPRNSVVEVSSNLLPTLDGMEISFHVPAVSISDVSDDESETNETFEGLAESSNGSGNSVVEVSLLPSPTPETAEISFHVPVVSISTVDSPSPIAEFNSPVNQSAGLIHNSPNPTDSEARAIDATHPTDGATDDTNARDQSTSVSNEDSSKVVIEAPSNQSPTLESATSSCVVLQVINQIVNKVVENSSKPLLSSDVIDHMDSATVRDLSTSMNSNQIVSVETATNSVGINDDHSIWSDEDVFADPDEPTPAVPVISPPELLSMTEDDRAHDHFYSCSSSIGGIKLKLKRETALILNEFCRSLGSSSPVTPSPSAIIQSIAFLSESQLSYAGFFNNKDSVPDISVKLSRCNSYVSLLTEYDSSG